MYSFLLSAHSTKRFYKLAHERATQRYRRKLAIARLLDENFIQKQSDRLSITHDGRSALGDVVARTLELVNKKAWDHKWRVAAFDIPEKYSTLRDKVRAVLKRAGFVKLQHSVWIFPHDCEELVLLIKEESRLSKHILYGVLDKIDDDMRLKRLFSLK